MLSAFGVEHTISKGVKVQNLLTMRQIGKPGKTGRAAEYARGKYLKRVYGHDTSPMTNEASRTTRSQRDLNRKGIF